MKKYMWAHAEGGVVCLGAQPLQRQQDLVRRARTACCARWALAVLCLISRAAASAQKGEQAQQRLPLCSLTEAAEHLKSETRCQTHRTAMLQPVKNLK